MAIKIRIKGKKIEDCSFNERTVLAIAYTHYFTVFNQLNGMATTGDLMISAMRTGSLNDPAKQTVSHELRSELRSKAQEQAHLGASKVVARFFPEFDLEFEIVSEPSVESAVS